MSRESRQRTRRSGSCRPAYKHCYRCTPTHSMRPDSNTPQSTDCTRQLSDTGRSPCTSQDWLRRTDPTDTSRTACTHFRHCKPTHSTRLDSNTPRSTDCTRQRRDTGHSPCTSPDWPPRMRPTGTYRSACTHCRHCMPSHSTLPDSNTLPSTHCTRRRRDTGHSLCTSQDWLQRMRPTDTYRSAYRHCHRYRPCHSTRLDSSTPRSTDCTRQLSDTGHSRCTSRDWLPRTLPTDTCRSACTRCRHCTPTHSKGPDWNTPRSTYCTRQLSDTGHSRCTSRDWLPRTLPTDTCRSACRRCHRYMPCHSTRLDSNTPRSTYCTRQPNDIGHSPCTSQDMFPRIRPTGRYRSACTRCRHCTPFHLPRLHTDLSMR